MSVSSLIQLKNNCVKCLGVVTVSGYRGKHFKTASSKARKHLPTIIVDCLETSKNLFELVSSYFKVFVRKYQK